MSGVNKTRKVGAGKKEKKDKPQKEETLSLKLTGAREGDTIEGMAPDTTGTVLRLMKGNIPVDATLVAELTTDDFIVRLAKQFNESHSMARQRYSDLPGLHDTTKKKQDNLGGCTFQILQPGIWTTFAENVGFADEFNAIVLNKTAVTSTDILRWVANKKLIMRHDLFKLSSGPRLVAQVPDGEFVTDTSVLGLSTSVIYLIENHYVKVPSSAPEMLKKAQVKALVTDALAATADDDDDADIEACFAHLTNFSQGGLKSALQKVIRFGANTVLLSHPIARQVKSNVYAAMAMALLIVDPGMFNPDIQTFVLGRTSAFKRLAIILLEDAWLPEKITELNALMSLSLVTSQVQEWYPPREMVLAIVRLASQAPTSLKIVNWRNTAKKDWPGNVVLYEEAITDKHIQEIQNAAKVLAIVRSFKGDIDMYATFARIAQDKKSLPILSATANAAPDVMPDCHIWDQHNKHGIGHVLPVAYGKTFAERFQKLFMQVTGMNPRWTDVDAFEAREVVQQARFAQKEIMRFALHLPQSSIPNIEKMQTSMSVPLHSGVLAAGVGPVTVPGDKYVLLGVEFPSDEIVMKIPQRGKHAELYEDISNEERETAIQTCREMQHPIQSPLLGPGTATYNIEKQVWCFNGRPWEEVRNEGITIKMPVCNIPDAWPDQWDVSVLDDYISAAMREYGTGVALPLKKHVKQLVLAFGNEVTMRVRSVLRQQYHVIALPTPNKDGKQAADKDLAYEDDNLVYRFLVLLARIAPGALRVHDPPNFKVQDARLLRWIEQFIVPVETRADEDEDEDEDEEGRLTLWTTCFSVAAQAGFEERRKGHPEQDAAVNGLIKRDKGNIGGHVLVMPAGNGKTTVCLRYLMHRVLHTPLGKSVKRIVWICPDDLSLTSLQKDMASKMQLCVHVVPMVHTGAKATPKMALKNGCINLIKQGNLSKAMMHADLGKYAPTSIVVIDEFDEFYNPSQRTSAGRELVRRSPLFVAQTGTPMSKKVTALAEWLADTETFPVNVTNYLVAASNMVQIQTDLGIKRHEVVIKLPLVQEVRDAFKQYKKDKNWLAMAKTTQAFTDDGLCATAKEYIDKDIAKNGPTGGVLLVADSNAHAAVLLENMTSKQNVKCMKYDENSDLDKDDTYHCVIVTKTQARGYNFAIRFGAIVKGVYAGDSSERLQMNGRIYRIGQKREEVFYVTVVMESSMLELLHDRQERINGLSLSLEQIAQQFQVQDMSM